MNSMLYFRGLAKTQNRSNKLRLRRRREMRFFKTVSGEVQRASFQRHVVRLPVVPGTLLAPAPRL